MRQSKLPTSGWKSKGTDAFQALLDIVAKEHNEPCPIRDLIIVGDGMRQVNRDVEFLADLVGAEKKQPLAAQESISIQVAAIAVNLGVTKPIAMRLCKGLSAAKAKPAAGWSLRPW